MSHSFTRRDVIRWSAAGGAALLPSFRNRAAFGAANYRFQQSDELSATLNDPGLHLVVDDEEIEETKNLVRFVNKPKRHGPVVVSDRPWEGRNRVQAWGTVIRDPNGLFRLWYMGYYLDRRPVEVDRSAMCYAESTDGIHWEKPNLGLYRYRGSTNNNIFYGFHPDGIHMTEEMLARRRMGLPAMTLDSRNIGIVNHMDGIGGVIRDDDEPDPDKR